MTPRRADRNRDGELYVPPEFEAEYLEEARRAVIRTQRPWQRMWVPLVQLWHPTSGHQRARLALTVVHGVAALLVVVFTVVTGEWLVGLVLLGAVGVLLAVGLTVARASERPPRSFWPGLPPREGRRR